MIINDLYISLLMLFVIRLCAFILFLMLYLQERKKSYLILLLGWLVYMIGPLPDILAFDHESAELNALFPYTAAIGSILIMFGVLQYIKTTRTFIIAIVTLSAGSSLAVFLSSSPSIRGLFATVIQAGFLLFMLILVVRYRKMFKGMQSGISFFWLCATLLLGLFHAIGFSFIYNNLNISVKFVMTAMINVTLILFIIFLDWEQANKILKKSLQEKEILLQEVHHRVKNNLMIISSIISLQRNKTSGKMHCDVLQGIENRISTMALVHEKLYESVDMQNISFANYLSELIDGIAVSFNSKITGVRVVKNIDDVSLDIDKLIPMGMLINEIATNAFKHAYNDIDQPELQIEFLHNHNGSCILRITDNGKGFAEDKLKKENESTGFTIINALVYQLNAELSIKDNHGAEFTVKIPCV